MRVRLRWTLALLATAGLVTAGFFLWPRLIRVKQTSRSITSTIVYTICGHRTQGGKINPSVAAILAERPIGARLGDWRLLGRDGQFLHVAHELNQLCPTCRRGRFLGVAEGLVAIYAGTPKYRGQVLEVTKIMANALPAAELADLERGIIVRDERERLQILEGLAALLNE